MHRVTSIKSSLIQGLKRINLDCLFKTQSGNYDLEKKQSFAIFNVLEFLGSKP
jgi:hypothetical protein